MSTRRERKTARRKNQPEEQPVEEPPVEEEPEVSGESRHFVVTTIVPVNVVDFSDLLFNVKNVELVKATGPGMESAIDMAKAEFYVETWPAVTDGVQKALVRVLGAPPK